MYLLLLAVAVILLACLLYAADRGVKAVRQGQRRRAAGERLAAAAAHAEEADKRRRAASEMSGAITSVMPAIRDGRDPRRVA